MDQTDIPREKIFQALEELEKINQYFYGIRPTLSALQNMVPSNQRSLSILDVGTGAGDLPVHILNWAKNQNINVEITGIDILSSAVEYANKKTANFPQITIRNRNVFTLDEANTYDIVHTAQTLHHFHGKNLIQFLQQLHRLCRLGVIISDLHRHPVAWMSILGFTRIWSCNDMIRNDAPLSVRKGFTGNELSERIRSAGLPAPHLQRHPGFRWEVRIS